jgi:hypothetical protein
MTKATRVHSTPRRTASKIKPSNESTAEKDASTATWAAAYFALESVICDVANMATIAKQAMFDSDGNASKQDKQLAFFSVYHLCDMVADLRRKYYEVNRPRDSPGRKAVT